MDLIMAATPWKSNAEMIEDVAKLGYIKPSSMTLDPTYGRGTWWKNFKPSSLTTHDLALDGVDFRKLPEADGLFDVVAFDPPYIAPGGRKSSTLTDFNDRYGLHSTPPSRSELQTIINGGIKEAGRVLKPRGILLAKCCDYVSSGHLWMGSHFTLTYALGNGFVLEDRLYHLRHPGPQSQKTQVHARQNLSTLLILKRTGEKKKLGTNNRVSKSKARRKAVVH